MDVRGSGFSKNLSEGKKRPPDLHTHLEILKEDLVDFLEGLPLARLSVTLFSLAVMARPAIIASVLFIVGATAFLAVQGFPPLLPTVKGIVTVVFGVAAAHYFNDFCDRRRDLANPRTRNRPLPGGLLPSGLALALSLLFLAIGVLSAFLINFPTGMIMAFGVVLILSYSAILKRTLGGFLPPALGAALLPIGAWSTYRPESVVSSVPLAMAIIGFCFELQPYWCRAIQDRKGDEGSTTRTLPVVLGPGLTAGVMLLMFLLAFWVMMFLKVLTPALGTPYLTTLLAGGIFLFVLHGILVIKRTDFMASLLYYASMVFITLLSMVIMLEVLFRQG